MSANTVIGKLSYASDKLMFADTVHSWYDPEDFEKFDGENMFLGEFYFSEIAGNTFDEDMWDYIYSDMIPVAKTQNHTTRYTESTIRSIAIAV